MPLNERESQIRQAHFDGTLPSGANLEADLTLNTGTNTANFRIRMSSSAGLQGVADDLKTIRNFLIQKYNLTP